MMALPSIEELAPILHRCRKLQNLTHTQSFHAQMCKHGLDAHSFLGNHLVSMFVEVGSISEAQRVFDILVYRNECSWNALIMGYVQSGKPHRALVVYQKIQEDDSIHLSEHAVVALLQACGKLKDLEKGCEVHDAATRLRLLKKNRYVGTALVDMYAKCGSLAKAQEIFDELPSQDSVSWNVLIAGYAEHGDGKQALKCFEQMQLEGFLLNTVTFVCSLKACATLGAVEEGLKIHAEIAKNREVESSLYVGNALVDMYCKCGYLEEAHDVFDNLSVRDVVSWNALIAGYCKQGLLARAQQMFDNLLVRDTVSWNVLIAGYAEHGHGKEAVKCFERMQLEGVPPSRVTYVCSLKGCASMGDMEKGEEIHAEIARRGLLKRDLVLGSTLVDMYVKCSSLAKAHEVFNKLSQKCVVSGTALIAGYAQEGLFVEAQKLFDNLPVRNVVSWNTMISGYAERGYGEEALKCFEQMRFEGVHPNAGTFVSTLKACGSIRAVDKGCELHTEVSQSGLVENDLPVGNALIDMYVKCGNLAKAQEVFDKLPVRDAFSCNALIAGYSEQGLLANAQELFDKLLARDVVSWNALITGYTEHGLGEEALKRLEQMQHEGVPPDGITYVCCLKACGCIGAIERGEELHAEIAKRGLWEKDLTVCNSVIDMYAKCGLLIKAQNVLENLLMRDVVSWNALIAGYVEHGYGKEALKCFEQMQSEGISPDAVTLTCILKASGNIGAVDKVQELHAEISRKGLWERDLAVGNTLVDVCLKCGLLAEAQEVFKKLPVRDVVTWNALIAGNAELIENENAAISLSRMTGEGIEPNLVTFLNIIKACSLHGLIDKGQKYFEAMSEGFGIVPTAEHHNCMVDLLGRAGHLDKAIRIFFQIPFHASPVMCHAVLDSCRKWGNVELGRHAFEHAVQMDTKDAAAYALMSYIYAGATMQEEPYGCSFAEKDLKGYRSYVLHYICG